MKYIYLVIIISLFFINNLMAEEKCRDLRDKPLEY